MALCRLFPKTHPARVFFPDRKKMAIELKNALQEYAAQFFRRTHLRKRSRLRLRDYSNSARRARERISLPEIREQDSILSRGGATTSRCLVVQSVPERTAGSNGPLLSHGDRVADVFDAAWYLREHPEIAAQGITPLQHYIERGVKEGCNPHPLFDTAWYLAMNPDVRSANINPLEHYIETGGREGRDPHPIFSSKAVSRTYPNVAAAGLNPLVDYITRGAKKRRSPRSNVSIRASMRKNIRKRRTSARTSCTLLNGRLE